MAGTGLGRELWHGLVTRTPQHPRPAAPGREGSEGGQIRSGYWFWWSLRRDGGDTVPSRGAEPRLRRAAAAASNAARQEALPWGGPRKRRVNLADGTGA